jgi:ribonuclease P protein subunit POP4
MASFCQKLSDKYIKCATSAGSGDLKKLFESKLPPADRKEIDGEFKKTLILAAQKSKYKNKKPPRKSKKALSASEKRSLGLYRLPKKGMLYSSFLPLHSLWRGYMGELLDLPSLEAGGWEPNLNEEPRQLQLQIRLCRADLHGAMVKVSAAHCPSYVGLEGIVVMETKNTLQIISDDNRLRYIPKLGSNFSFKVKDYLFTLPGSSIDSKPGERATKKLKNKLPMDF